MHTVQYLENRLRMHPEIAGISCASRHYAVHRDSVRLHPSLQHLAKQVKSLRDASRLMYVLMSQYKYDTQCTRVGHGKGKRMGSNM